jgi:AcrR family transcriptional regulator
MARSALTARRKAQTRRDIADVALALFERDGYDSVSAEAIASQADVSLRTFYRYFSAKEEVLSPIITDGIRGLAENLAARPAEEDLMTAVLRAHAEIPPPRNPEDDDAIIRLHAEVPALHARWLGELRAIEEALVPIVRQRTQGTLTEAQTQITAAAIATALRIALETPTGTHTRQTTNKAFAHALRYLRDGAHL